jgi:hypothetical protein
VTGITTRVASMCTWGWCAFMHMDSWLSAQNVMFVALCHPYACSLCIETKLDAKDRGTALSIYTSDGPHLTP